jgi:hypothetical protein
MSGKPKSTVRGTILRLKIAPVVEDRPAVVRLLKQIGAVPSAAPKVACIRVRAAIKLLTKLYANPSITQYLSKLRNSDPPATRNRLGCSVHAASIEPRYRSIYRMPCWGSWELHLGVHVRVSTL